MSKEIRSSFVGIDEGYGGQMMGSVGGKLCGKQID